MRCSGRVPLLTNPDPPPTGSATGSGPRPAASSASFATRQGICGAKVLVKYRNQRSSMPRDSVALISADELKCHSRDSEELVNLNASLRKSRDLSPPARAPGVVWHKNVSVQYALPVLVHQRSQWRWGIAPLTQNWQMVTTASLISMATTLKCDVSPPPKGISVRTGMTNPCLR